jgi:hypothetical protein
MLIRSYGYSIADHARESPGHDRERDAHGRCGQGAAVQSPLAAPGSGEVRDPVEQPAVPDPRQLEWQRLCLKYGPSLRGVAKAAQMNKTYVTQQLTRHGIIKEYDPAVRWDWAVGA